jgi:N-methylhydantoinase B
LSVRSPGSGGYGDPLERPPERVQEDVAAGLLSHDAAREYYGVVMDHVGVDVQATEVLRNTRAQERGPTDFDFGPARRAHERVWTADLYATLHAIIEALPISYRSLVRRRLYEAVRARAETGAPVTVADLHQAWEAIRGSLRA